MTPTLRPGGVKGSPVQIRLRPRPGLRDTSRSGSLNQMLFGYPAKGEAKSSARHLWYMGRSSRISSGGGTATTGHRACAMQ
jgi:hypothetical protein